MNYVANPTLFFFNLIADRIGVVPAACVVIFAVLCITFIYIFLEAVGK